MDTKTMARLTMGKYDRTCRAEKAIEELFIVSGINIDEYTALTADFFEELINLYGQEFFDKYIQKRHE